MNFFRSFLMVAAIFYAGRVEAAGRGRVIGIAESGGRMIGEEGRAGPGGKIIDPVVCKADPSQSYALYIPAKGNAAAMPVIYFFDPHGKGAFPLNKYRLLAETYGFILAGSNNSQNGNDWSTTEKIWQVLSADTKSRLKIDARRIYTCGFSGGAKVAGFVAIQHPGIRGVIAGGAGLPDGVGADNFDFSLTAIAGEGDMNLTELVGISSELDKTRTRHHMIFFDGKHEWAPAATMEKAFAGLQLDAMWKGVIPKDDGFIQRYAAKSKGRVAGFEQAHQWIKADRECRLSISLLDGLTGEVTWFRNKAASLAANPLFQQQKQTEQSLLAREQNTKTEYMQHFQLGDARYWNAVVADLNGKIKARSPESSMDQRLLDYLSLAFYSFSNQLIRSNNNGDARRFVDLYKMADPENSEAWYFSAIVSAREGQIKAAQSDLMKAVACGFLDKARMRSQPEFRQLDLGGVERKMGGH